MPFGLKVLGALGKAGKIKEPVAQEAAWSRSMDAAYAFAEKHVPDLALADKIQQAVILAHEELTKR